MAGSRSYACVRCCYIISFEWFLISHKFAQRDESINIVFHFHIWQCMFQWVLDVKWLRKNPISNCNQLWIWIVPHRLHITRPHFRSIPFLKSILCTKYGPITSAGLNLFGLFSLLFPCGKLLCLANNSCKLWEIIWNPFETQNKMANQEVFGNRYERHKVNSKHTTKDINLAAHFFTHFFLHNSPKKNRNHLKKGWAFFLLLRRL